MAHFELFRPNIMYVITLSMSLEQRYQIYVQLCVQLTLLICIAAGITSIVFVCVDWCLLEGVPPYTESTWTELAIERLCPAWATRYPRYHSTTTTMCVGVNTVRINELF